jgi:hypothetical protein
MKSRRALLALPFATLMASAAWAADLATPRQAAKKSHKPAPLPPGYVAMGKMHGVPPIILYGVALQESAKLFGPHVLPYPWTLNVRGTPMRFQSYQAAVAALRSYVTAGITSVDCGLLQVNWRCHHDKLGSFWAALDPYPNIGVGARLLREHFDDTRDWFRAVAHYHNKDPKIGLPYATAVYRRIADIPAPGAAGGDVHG